MMVVEYRSTNHCLCGNAAFVWIVLLIAVTAPQPMVGYDVTYSEHRACSDDSDCVSGRQEVCLNLYEGCSMGICACPPDRTRNSPTDICQPVILGDSDCKRTVQCPGGMVCSRRKCVCDTGSRLSLDKRHCFRAHQRLLGQECSPSENECLQKTAFVTPDEQSRKFGNTYSYSSNDVVCSRRGECECAEGTKEDNGACRLLNIGESGCLSSYHCQGGAVCRNGRCVCPAEYASTPQNTLCVRKTAIMNLPLGSGCDEILEKRYCTDGLVCHKCPQHSTATCVRYHSSPFTDRENGYTGGSSTTSCLLSMLLTMIFITRVVHSLL